MTTARRDHLRGQLVALRAVRKWLMECWTRNLAFLVEYPAAPKWQLLASKYGALTQEGHINGLDVRIAKVSEKLRRLKHRGY